MLPGLQCCGGSGSQLHARGRQLRPRGRQRRSAAGATGLAWCQEVLVGGKKEEVCRCYGGLAAIPADCSNCQLSLAVQVPWPFYFIGTRDSFAHHLIPVE